MSDSELLELIASQMGKLTQDVGDLKKGQEDLINRVKKVEVTLENVIDKKIDISLEGYQHLFEKLQEHDKRFDDIETKMDNMSLKVTKHDAKLEVFEGGKKK